MSVVGSKHGEESPEYASILNSQALVADRTFTRQPHHWQAQRIHPSRTPILCNLRLRQAVLAYRLRTLLWMLRIQGHIRTASQNYCRASCDPARSARMPICLFSCVTEQSGRHSNSSLDEAAAAR